MRFISAPSIVASVEDSAAPADEQVLRGGSDPAGGPSRLATSERSIVVPDDPPQQTHDDLARVRLAAIVTASSEAIIGATLDGIITDWNPAAEQFYGYSADEAIGQSLTVLAPPDRIEEILELLDRVGRGESIAELDTVRRTKSGRLIDISKTIWPVHNDAGQVIAAATITRDISVRKTAEADLAATHQQTRQVLERITDGFYALDRDWRFTYINPMAEKILGRPREELLGKIIWGELGDATETSLYATYHQAMNEGVNSRVEVYYFQLGAWFEARVYPSAAGLSVFFRDMTARKELEQKLGASETRYRALVEQIPAVVYVLAADENQTPLYFSPRIQELTGESPDEALAVKEHWLESVHPDDYARVAEEDERTTASGEPFRLEYRQRRKDGSYVWVRDECVPIHDAAGQVVAWQGVLLDVSARVQLEAAQEANRTKSLFLGMMSHELRTPMQLVLGYAALLLAGHRGPLTAEQLEDIGYIRLGADRMMTLIEQMLDLSQLEAGQLQLAADPVDLPEIIEGVRQEVAPRIAAQGLELVIELAPSLPAALGDARRMRQIVRNLVDNAVKFTEAGSIHITACATRNGVEIAVRDTGIGMTEEAKRHVFEAFRQLDSGTSRPYGGAGLGLAIARKLAEQMEGSISVVSMPDAGSTFTLHLPAATLNTTATGR